MHIFQESLLKLWNQWHLRVMVLLSLSLQVILIILGSRRKHLVNRWLQIIVWLAYMSADTVASMSLGILTHRQGDCNENPNNLLQQLWFPFLLLHLGGPDTITAYSLEDNELWLRHLITLLGQVSAAFYVFLTSQTPSAFIELAVPILAVGLLKYGERIWVLRSASQNHFRNSMRDRHCYATTYYGYNIREENDLNGDLNRAYSLFCMSGNLFAGFPLELYDALHGLKTLLEESAMKAFDLVEIELGFVYDVIYTRASIIYSKLGIFRPLISFSCLISSLTAFPFIIGKYDHYSKIDIFITYLLLVGAILLEIYALFLVFCSDWIRVNRWRNRIREPFVAPTIFSVSKFLPTKRKRWSRSMAQHDLINFCLENRTKPFRKLFATNKYAEQEVKDSLKEFLFQKIKERVGACLADVYINEETQKRLLAQRGEQVLTKMGCLDDFREYTIDVDFDHSLLIWHIATCICDRMETMGNPDKSKHELGRSISKYMLYLLVECPQMLPTVSGQFFYQDACKDAKIFFKKETELAENFKSKPDNPVLEQSNEAISGRMGTLREGDYKYSWQLKNGFKLAQKLRSQPNKWELISELWVEMLIYAASHANWRNHAQRLMKGGELLTHVALLTAHLGFSEQTKLDF